MQLKSDYFLLPYLLILFILLPVQILYDQVNISLLVNSFHTSFLDQLCKYGTHLGDGVFVVVICLILLTYNPRLASTILVSYLLSAGLAQFLKHVVFSHTMRPLAIIQQLNINPIHLVEGVNMNFQNSFPSGHTASSFAFFTALSFFTNSPYKKILFLFIGLFVAFTRIYLLQHFLIDTYIGSIIGCFTSILVYYYLIRKNGYEWVLNKFKRNG